MPKVNRMASVQILPLANYANGTRQSSAMDIADDVTHVDFSIQRCTTATPTIWPNASTTLEIIPEVSLDAGVTWLEAGRSASAGGISRGKQGEEIAFAIGGGGLPPGINRQYRVRTIIAGGPLRSAATAEVT